MATILYKDGAQCCVEYGALKRHLDAGWTTSVQSETQACSVSVDEKGAAEKVSISKASAKPKRKTTPKKPARRATKK